MSFSVESFVDAPKLSTLSSLKKAELTALAQHYKLEVTNTMKKSDIRKLLAEYLVEEEIVSDDDELASDNVVELKKLELKDKEKERESQLRLKEIELRERELATQLKIKELEIAAATAPTDSAPRRADFDVSKHVRFVPPFQETEVDKYFLHFEKVASSLAWPKGVWTLLLQSALLGKAREAYSALSVDQSSEYETVKTAVLRAYELVPEAYRQKFRNSKKGESQTYVEFARTKETLFDRWCTSKEVQNDFGRLRQLVLMEEFKNCLPSEIKTYLDEQKVDSLHQAAVRADDYALTHKSFGKTPLRSNNPVDSDNSNRSGNPAGVGKTGNRGSSLPAGPTCYYCRRKGHVMSECRALQKKNEKSKPDLIVSQPGNKNNNTIPEEYAPFISYGTVSFLDSSNQKPVTILRDTGASQSLIRDDILSFCSRSDTRMTVLLQGVELGVFNVPLHKICLNSTLVNGPVVVGVRPSLPVQGVGLILGNDLAGGKVVVSPHVSQVPCNEETAMNTGETSELFSACAVTRAMSRAASKQPITSISADQGDTLEGVTNTFLDGEVDGEHEASDVSVPNVSVESVPQGVDDHSGSGSLLSREALIREQERDKEISKLTLHAIDEKEATTVPGCYFWKSGILMRKWRPPEVPASHEWKVVYQVVLPPMYRSDVLSLAHETPMAGHLGVNKTYRKILNHFYWPGVRKDVKRFCRTCHTCQMVGKPNQNPPLAPLKPIPVTTEPFSHVIIDCVGPLPKTKDGNQYLLTIMCASTRFPEAIPLRTIKAPKIVRALIKFFTLVGLPKSVQSDQGSNFMSHLFQEVMLQLGIKQVKSTPYHPQTQGALERFHQTLKNMMRAYCFQENRDWDEGIPLLLFAAREAIQESLGFSPFELVFGHTPRGPLKLLKETWLSDDVPESLLTRMSNVRHRLRTANELAQKHLKAAQSTMKTWYDRKSRDRVFKSGDKVLVLLPVHGSPLQARYCGPYTIEEKVNSVDYVISTPGRRKAKRLCHVNMLKAYHEKQETQGTPKAVSVVSLPSSALTDISSQMVIEDESRESVKLQNSDVLEHLERKLSHLPVGEREAITQLVREFVVVFPDVPGKTNLASHDVNVGDARPIKQHPYRLHPNKLAVLRKELQYMLQHGIVEPSQSEWSSPCVLVPKADGSYRFCTDFRKVNAVTKSDSFPLPRVEDCIDYIGKSQYISKFDLLKGYWQVPLTTRAKEISAFVTPDGLFQYTVMPFGMKNAPATFQRMINHVIRGLEGCQAYIDDIVVYSDNWDQHVKQLREFLCRLKESKLTVNLVKTEFCHARVEFLGHVVGQGWISPVTAKVEAIAEFPVPTDQHQLIRFLGMAGYYRKFCHNFSTIAEPLTALLKKGKKFVWLPECQSAFEKIRSILFSVPVLMAPDFQKQFKLFVDASDVGIGAVLFQEDSYGVDHPVCYYSKKLNCHQQNYSTSEKETLALILALQHFDVYVGSTVTPVKVFTDHNPLVFVNKMKNRNQRLVRWSLALQEYNLDIEHIKGRDNVIADALSRAV